MPLHYIAPGGQILNNYVKGSTNFSVDTTEHKATVPAGKRWFLFGGVTNRDANATIAVTVFDDADQEVLYLIYDAAGTGTFVYPSSQANDIISRFSGGFPMAAGWYIKFKFGAAQGVAAFVSATVIEVIE